VKAFKVRKSPYLGALASLEALTRRVMPAKQELCP